MRLLSGAQSIPATQEKGNIIALPSRLSFLGVQSAPRTSDLAIVLLQHMDLVPAIPLLFIDVDIMVIGAECNFYRRQKYKLIRKEHKHLPGNIYICDDQKVLLDL